jgi:hypothetical protein
MSFGYQVLGFGSSAASRALILDITSNAAQVNILTLAQAEGYDESSDSTPIIVNVASGVTISASSSYAMRTGALNANSDLTINVFGTITGYNGADGTHPGNPGGNGGAGGDAIYFETATGGSATLKVVNSGLIQGGKGGRGGGGTRGSRHGYGFDNTNKQFQCNPDNNPGIFYGSNGAQGAAASDFGQAGGNGSAGSFGGGSTSCVIASPGSGGSGGAGGFAVRKNSRTVTTSGSTYKGSTA